MNAKPNTQQFIRDFADAVARHYLDLQRSGGADHIGDSIDDFVSAIELDLRSTLRSRLEKVQATDKLESTSDIDVSKLKDDSDAQRMSGDFLRNNNESEAAAAGSQDLVDRTEYRQRTESPIETPTIGSANTIDFGTVASGIPSAGSHPHSLPDGYEFIDVLGRGGMGVVFKAQHTPLKRTVAVKMILAGHRASPDQIVRFQREAEAAAHLKHPNIVSVYEVGQHNGLPYFSLEYIEGETVADRLRNNTLTPIEAAHLLISVARAVQYSHDMGVLHRDLKPQNILLTQDGVPKVADFGLAKRFDLEPNDADQTREGILIGTPGYMAPEQVTDSRTAGPESDVYSLGSILYCILTGKPPHAAPTPFETVKQLMALDPVRPSTLQNGLDADVETICLKALEKDVERRYSTAGELADDLQRFVDGKPILARPITRIERASKWCKRNPKLAVASGLAAVLLLCLLGGGIGSALIINAQKNAEQIARLEAESNGKLAEDQAELALDTTRAILYETKDFFDGKPELAPLRQRMINEVMTRVEKLHAERYDDDVETTFSASGDAQLGELYLIAGAYELSLERLTEAEKKLKHLNADGTLYRANVSQMNLTQALGDVHRKLGHLNESEQQYLSLLDQRKAFFSSASAKELRMYEGEDIADVFGKLAGIYRDLGQPDKELTYQTQSVDARRDDHETNRVNVGAKERLASALIALSGTLERSGDLDGMLTASQSALQLQSEVAAERSDAATLHNTGVKQKAVARQCLLRGKLSEAKELIEQAQQSIVQASKSLTEDSRSIAALVDVYYWRGVIERQTGGEPSSSFEKAAELQRERLKVSNSVNNRGMLLKILSRAGRIDEATPLAEKMAEDPDDLMGSGYVACAYTLMSEHAPDGTDEHERLTQKAIDWTRTLIRNGYHDFESLGTTDLDFKPLQSNAGYMAMLDAERKRLKSKP